VTYFTDSICICACRSCQLLKVRGFRLLVSESISRIYSATSDSSWLNFLCFFCAVARVAHEKLALNFFFHIPSFAVFFILPETQTISRASSHHMYLFVCICIWCCTCKCIYVHQSVFLTNWILCRWLFHCIQWQYFLALLFMTKCYVN